MNLRTEAARSLLHIRRAGDHRVALAASAAISDATRESARPGTGIPGVSRAALRLSAALECPHRDVLVLVPAVVPRGAGESGRSAEPSWRPPPWTPQM